MKVANQKYATLLSEKLAQAGLCPGVCLKNVIQINMNFTAPRLCRLLLLALPFAWSAQAHASATEQFLVITDIHFDPFEGQTLFNKLAAAPASQWEPIMTQYASKHVSVYPNDSNYTLLESSLAAAAAAIPHPDFILYPGDFLAHEWTSKYDSYAPSSHQTDSHAYQQFTAKVIQFMADRFSHYFPGVPVLPTLGNDDSLCGDYMVEPNGIFLQDFSNIWAPLVGSGISAKAFRNEFSYGGYYSTILPGLPDTRLVVLNSVFFDVDYENDCGQSTETPGMDEILWLEDTIATADKAGEDVWLLMHVPPGINSYSSASAVSKGDAPVSMWQDVVTASFAKLVADYPNTLHLAFAGHTHMDDFRVIQGNGKSVFLTKIAPAVSPVFGNNPGFQVYDYDSQNGELLNYRAHYLSNISTNGVPTQAGNLKWALEYDFNKTYGQSSIDADTMTAVANAISASGSSEQASYIKFYPTSAQPEFTTATAKGYSSSLLNLTKGEYRDCFTSSK